MPEMWEVLEKEKAEVLAEIHEVFRGVSREGGVSWSEADVLDMYGTEQEQAAARASDKDTHWQQLFDDKAIIDCASNWSFLDPIGFRYYLPIGLVRTLRHKRDFGITFHLTLPEVIDGEPDDLRQFTLSKWSRFDERQKLCVRRFIEYMIAYHKSESSSEWLDWQAALDSYWSTVA